MEIGGLQYRILEWGKPVDGVPPLLLLHGWMDVAASFQFLVDCFEVDRYIIAPDLRGFGLTEAPQGGAVWEPEYLADIDYLVDHYSADAALDLVGHSMGAYLAMTYAGVRSDRVRKLVNMESFGRPRTDPDTAPAFYSRWLDDVKSYREGLKALRPYNSVEDVASRLKKTNPRLGPDQALWLAHQWSRRDDAGRWYILADPVQKVMNGQLHRVEEERAIWRNISAPVLAIEAIEDSFKMWWGDTYSPEEYIQRTACVENYRRVVLDDAGHMLHHDQPAQVARLIEAHIGQ